ncbi:hypothetical protein [Pleurocapsa sp. FMAR1]|uniref:hypothetical protein n=1 Tax=Pleurocapsa sp. FMAR1 TaxID=3040204 RepID=UPI0029C605F1|nr:hypothetical protein [Pleurocapsa sp. FMAR1]
MRKQKTTAKSNQEYNQTQFVQQFAKMGYQLRIDPKSQPETNRGNISPEIPQAKIEPKL